MDTTETPEKSTGEKMWDRVLGGISGSPRRQGGPQGLSQIPAVTPLH